MQVVSFSRGGLHAGRTPETCCMPSFAHALFAASLSPVCYLFLPFDKHNSTMHTSRDMRIAVAWR